MKKQLLKFSNQYYWAYYEVTFDSETTYRDLLATILNELALTSQEEYEMSQSVRNGEDYDDLPEEYMYELYGVEALDLEDDLEIGYEMINSGCNG